MRSFPLLTLLLCTALHGQFQEVQISVLNGTSVSAATVMGIKGGLVLLADDRIIGELAPNDGFRVEVLGDKLVGRTLAASYSAKERFTLRAKQLDSGVRLRALVPKLAERIYGGSLDIRRLGKELRFVVEERLDDYVAGVVQSEAGNEQALEYYKLQAVICRSYALANARKHAPEGFELCDQVHCQVFKGRATHPPILEAARATRGMVAVDADIRLIHATFHSNCGGETMNAEDLWSKSEPYLCATRDTFCLAQPHATWSRTISTSDWLNYLKRTYGVRIDDIAVRRELLAFEPGCRGLYLNSNRPLISLKQVRDDWKLRSTFFSLSTVGDSVVLRGRGFGHGVGLCQEGAMEMARRGIPFVDILHQYYREVHLVDLSSLEFFRD
ncbi:MAG: SpoIID/LytB domain-containing protein [Flavobacteriales bacterium]|nr:SpoIID/LytB domain-containing protein [Flavobacteriales bacterium]